MSRLCIKKTGVLKSTFSFTVFVNCPKIIQINEKNILAI